MRSSVLRWALLVCFLLVGAVGRDLHAQDLSFQPLPRSTCSTIPDRVLTADTTLTDSLRPDQTPTIKSSKRPSGAPPRIQGEMAATWQFVVDTTGRVIPCSMVPLKYTDQPFAGHVGRTILAMTFVPGTKDGSPVAVLTQMTLEARGN